MLGLCYLSVVYERIRQWLLLSLRPADAEHPGSVRKVGALNIAIGLVAVSLIFVAVSVASSLGADTQIAVKIAFPLAFVGLSAVAIGSYRLVLGAEPDESKNPVVRLLLGVGCGCVTVAVLGVLLVVLADIAGLV